MYRCMDDGWLMTNRAMYVCIVVLLVIVFYNYGLFACLVSQFAVSVHMQCDGIKTKVIPNQL